MEHVVISKNQDTIDVEIAQDFVPGGLQFFPGIFIWENPEHAM